MHVHATLLVPGRAHAYICVYADQVAAGGAGTCKFMRSSKFQCKFNPDVLQSQCQLRVRLSHDRDRSPVGELHSVTVVLV